VLPQPMNPMMAEKYWMFGPINNQAASIFQQVSKLLPVPGLQYADLYFMRTIMFPENGKPIGPNFGVFNREYSKHLNNEHNPNRPTRTVMSAPGYTYRKQLMALELYGLIPRERSTLEFRENAVLAFDQNDALGSDGVAVAPDAGLEFFSGVISPEALGDITVEAEAIMESIRGKLEARGLDLDDIVHLRAYVVGGDNPAAAVGAWEAVYQNYFSTEGDNTFEPALTTMPILALPGDRLVEVEILAAHRQP